MKKLCVALVFILFGIYSCKKASHIPITPTPTPTKLASFAAGMNHFLWLKTDGTIWSWGSNNFGQLGD